MTLRKMLRALLAGLLPHKRHKIDSHWQLNNYQLSHSDQQVQAQFMIGDKVLDGQGAGALEALCSALNQRFDCVIEIGHFDQHALGEGTDAKAQACIQMGVDGSDYCAVAIAEDSTAAALQALLTAFGRSGTKALKGVA